MFSEQEKAWLLQSIFYNEELHPTVALRLTKKLLELFEPKSVSIDFSTNDIWGDSNSGTWTNGSIWGSSTDNGHKK